MLTKEAFHNLLKTGPMLLDGATGSNLLAQGMPKGVCAEAWILEHPQVLLSLQRAYGEAGSQILYAPTFQAQPAALARVGLEDKTEEINAKLVALTRSAAPSALVAGDLATLSAYLPGADEEAFDLLVENYRRQFRGLIDGGADLFVAETLIYAQEAEAVMTAAELEGAEAVIYSFVLSPGGALCFGADALPVFQELERGGAAAVGFNCVAASEDLPALTAKLRRQLTGPILCKPNAGVPAVREDGTVVYPMGKDQFADILTACAEEGAALLGGCCGTTPEYLAACRARLQAKGFFPNFSNTL